MKQKKCKVCKEPFEPQRGLQVACSFLCALKLAKEIERKSDKKKWQGEKKVMKEKLKTLSDWKKDLEHLVNKIARLIDFGNPCISCGGLNSPQGGHFHAVKANPAIRFNLFNIFVQDYYCNVKLSSNRPGYNEGLIKTFGKEIKEYIEYDIVRLYPSIHLSVPEIKAAISICREIIKELERKNYVYDAETRISLRKLYNDRIGIYK